MCALVCVKRKAFVLLTFVWCCGLAYLSADGSAIRRPSHETVLHCRALWKGPFAGVGATICVCAVAERVVFAYDYACTIQWSKTEAQL